MTDPKAESEFDIAMLEQGVPIDLIGRSGTLALGPSWGHPEANPMRDLVEFWRFGARQHLEGDNLDSGGET